MNRKDQLNEELLRREYVVRLNSAREIGEKYGLSAKQVTRLLKKYNIPTRTRSEAQKIVVSRAHPTKGKTRTEEEKAKISESVSKQWTLERRELQKEVRKRTWKNMTDDEKERGRQKAHDGLRRAAKEGSAMELFLSDFLTENKIINKRHVRILTNVKLEADIVIPSLGIAIEIDGVTHRKPIYGEERFNKVIKADNEKNALFLQNKFRVIRLFTGTKNLSMLDKRKVCELVLKTIESLKGQPPQVVLVDYEGGNV